MFSPGYLQTDENTAGWIWFVVLAILLLIVIIWWFNRRRAEPEVTATSEPVVTQGVSDDLTRIEGIGPKVARVLNESGITTFEALARAEPGEVQQTLNAAGLQMMSPEGWIEQAGLAAKGDWEGFQRLQNELKGGRKR
jgi:large subunit ribosomal protein L17